MSPRFSMLCQSVLASALLAAPAFASEPWVDLGSPLAGTLGDPVLAGSGSLFPGNVISVELSNARPNAPAGLFLGLAPVSLPFKGGTLQVNPLIPPVVINTSGSGEIPLAFAWPDLPPETEISFQYVIDDPAAILGFALSNGLLATNEVIVPTATGLSVSTIAEGMTVDVLGSDFDLEPISYCAQVVDGNGEAVAFLKGVSANGSSLSLSVDTVLQNATTGTLVIMPGHGFTPTVEPAGGLELTGVPWVWDGDPADAVAVPGVVTLVPPPPATSCTTAPAVLNASKTMVTFEFQDLEGVCLKNTEFVFDLHFNKCPDYTHYDAYVPLGNPDPKTTAVCAGQILTTVKEVFKKRYGPTYEQQFIFFPSTSGGSDWALNVLILNGTFCGVGGYLRICGDTACDNSVGVVQPNGLGLTFDMPCVPGAEVTADINADFIGGPSCAVTATVTIPDPAPSPAACADLLIQAIEAEFVLCGGGVSGVFNDATGEVTLLPPMFPSTPWSPLTAAQISVCP